MSVGKSLKDRVQSLDRACDILQCLADQGPALGVSEIAGTLGLSKSTVHRLLIALETQRLVRQVSAGRKYQLGIRLFELGLKAVDEQGLVTSARPRLTSLVTATGETAHLGVLREGEVVSVCAVESPRTLRTPSTVGRRTPAHSSSLGKAILAFAPEEDVHFVAAARGLARFTPTTLCDPEALSEELALIRRRGYAIDNEEFEEGLKCIGAPVWDATGAVTAAVSIAGPAKRLNKDAMPRLIGHVRETAFGLSADLGYGGEMTGT